MLTVRIFYLIIGFVCFSLISKTFVQVIWLEILFKPFTINYVCDECQKSSKAHYVLEKEGNVGRRGEESINNQGIEV